MKLEISPLVTRSCHLHTPPSQVYIQTCFFHSPWHGSQQSALIHEVWVPCNYCVQFWKKDCSVHEMKLSHKVSRKVCSRIQLYFTMSHALNGEVLFCKINNYSNKTKHFEKYLVLSFIVCSSAEHNSYRGIHRMQ